MSREEQGKERPFDVAKEVICMQSCLALPPGFQSSFLAWKPVFQEELHC